MKHHLDPLLRPRSVAVVGASARADSLGEWSLTNLLRGGFGGNIYPVNPRYRELQGLKCFTHLGELPEVPDLVLYGIADNRIEQALDEAIALHVPASVLMSPLALDHDTVPDLKTRLKQKIADAGMLVCGANGMGYYNVRDNVWACGFDSRRHPAPGNVSLISHSGSGMSGIIDCEERIRINFAVSTGNEIGVTMDQYLDFVLDLPETRVVGLFVETARNPQAFRAALAKAAAKKIPVVALKVGRTERAAQLTVSHSGALAGVDATYDALFDRYGVQRVRDMDELATALILFAELHPVGPGALVTLHDSGGERQLMVDLADEAGVPLAELGPATVKALEELLDPELPAVNPLDAWSRGGDDAAGIISGCLARMLQDPNAALGALLHDRGPEGVIYASYVDYIRQARAASGKPVALVAARQGTGCDPAVVAATHEGYPVLDGVPAFLAGVRALFSYRDFCELDAAACEPPPARHDAVAHDAVAQDVVAHWRNELAASRALDEARSLRMLGDFGIPANTGRVVESEAELAALAPELRFPVVLKTAAAGLMHKTEHRGVILDLRSGEALLAAWRTLAGRLGPRAMIAPMVDPGVEMILGARRDPQFGPVVLLGFGGAYAEVLEDVVFALPPFDGRSARRLVGKLKMRAMLDGQRGNAVCNIGAFCELAARFSAMVHELRDVIEEIDVNPIVVTVDRSIAVDALVVGRNTN